MSRLPLALVLVVGLSACGGGSGSSSSSASITVSPTSVSVQINGQLQFHATVSHLSSTAVTWEVNGVMGGNSTVGAISASGLFTAPAKVPASNPVTVTAVSQGQSGLSATASVTIVPITLVGQYAFSFSGTNNNGSFFLAGSFTADGVGNITSGIEDTKTAVAVHQGLTLTGTYTIGTDGRGVISLKNSAGAIQTLAFVLEAGNHGEIIWFDNSANGFGSLDKQDTTAFSLNAIQGNYAFRLDGVGVSGADYSSAGVFTLGACQTISKGTSDTNDGGIVKPPLSVSGSVSSGPDTTNGRGIASFTCISNGGTGSCEFAFYVISQTKLILIEIDSTSNPAVAGRSEKQSGAPFSSKSLAGNYAFSLGGTTTVGVGGSIADIGQFTSNGANLITSGEVDENDAGTGTVTTTPLTGSYTGIASNSRGTMILNLPVGAANFAFYMVSPSKVFVLETDVNQVTSGEALGQQGGVFQTSSLKGNYGFEVSGGAFVSSALSTSFLPIDKSGHFLSDGLSAISGTEDLNAPGAAPFSQAIMSGSTFSVDASGRGTLTVVTPNGTTDLVFYFASPSQILLIGTSDGSQVILGEARLQPF